MDAVGWFVTAVAVLLTGISKSGLGGALGGLAVPFMSMWISPRDAVAVMLPILIAMDFAGIRAWRGKADWAELRLLIPSALVGIGLGTLAFGVLPDRVVKGAVGLIAVAFALDRMLRRGRAASAVAGDRKRAFAWLCGAGAGFTSTLAHAGGPPVMIYLLSRKLPKQAFAATSVFFFAVINLAKLPFYLGLDSVQSRHLADVGDAAATGADRRVCRHALAGAHSGKALLSVRDRGAGTVRREAAVGCVEGLRWLGMGIAVKPSPATYAEL